MNKAFEKILERLEAPQFDMGCAGCLHIETCDIVQEHIANEKTDLCAETMRNIAKSIVQEVAEEYNGGWIPCSERLPDEVNKYYLVMYRRVIFGEFEYSVNISYFSTLPNGDKSWEIEEERRYLEVIAWQPLPEPYKESD